MLILLILIPLIWVLRFKDFKTGLVFVVSGMIAGNAIISILLQSLGLFKFNLIFIIHILIALFTIFFNFKYLREIKFKKISWFFLIAFAIITLQFYFVHFSYSGKISTVNDIKTVENFSSNYPYFSDEWIAVGMSEKIIETQGLPFINIFNNTYFINFLFVFHSFISGIDLLLNLDLITDFKFISISLALVLITFSYLLIRSHNISIGVAILTIFLISYLPNSSNLPLLWYLLPWNVGLIFFIAYLFAVQKQYFKVSLLLNLLSIIFYPPIAILSVPSFIFSCFKNENKKDIRVNLIIYIGSIILSVIFAVLFMYLGNSISISKIFSRINDFMVRELSSGLNNPPLFIIWRVVPWFITPFAFWSLWKIRRNYAYLSIPIFIGITLWLLYASKFPTIFIDYHRTVAITSILLIIASSFTLEIFKDYLFKKFKFLNNNKNILICIMLGLFLFLSFSYTKRENWMNFKAGEYYPSPPANQYLINEDLELFKDIKGKRFLAVPWKGLVLAIATDNIPVITKPSTLTVNLVNYSEFMNFDCNKKYETSKKLKIDYLYIPEINCPKFELMGKSSEGLHLYLVK